MQCLKLIPDFQGYTASQPTIRRCKNHPPFWHKYEDLQTVEHHQTPSSRERIHRRQNDQHKFAKNNTKSSSQILQQFVTMMNIYLCTSDPRKSKAHSSLILASCSENSKVSITLSRYASAFAN